MRSDHNKDLLDTAQAKLMRHSFAEAAALLSSIDWHEVPPEKVISIAEDFLAAGKDREATRLVLDCLPSHPGDTRLWSRVWKPTTPGDLAAEAAEIAVELAEAGMGVAPSTVITAVQIMARSDQPARTLEHATAVRDRLINAREDRVFWLARLAFQKNDHASALDLVGQWLDRRPRDERALVLRGNIAARTGRIGEYAHLILPLRSFPRNLAAQQIVEAADDLLLANGSSLEAAARCPAMHAHISAPGAVFEYATRTAPLADPFEARKGLVMLCGSLAGGGAERIAATIFSHLSQGAFEDEIEFWLYNRGQSRRANHNFYADLIGPHTDRVIDLGRPQKIEVPFRWLSPFYAEKSQVIYDRLMEMRPAVLHASLDQAILPGAIAAIMAGVPRIVLHCHNMRPAGLFDDGVVFGWDRAYAALLSRPEVILLNVSDTGLDDYLDWMGAERSERTLRVFNGFDFSTFAAPAPGFIATVKAEIGIPAEAPVVGTALRFTEVKRPLRWIEAASLILEQRPDTHFVLYGDGDLIEGVRAYATSLGIADHVHFPGRVNDLSRRLALFDVFMLSSRSEGLPNVLIEAQACGVTPITYNVGGCSETLIDGETGRLVHEDSAQALADAVAGVLNDPDWRQRASVRGVQFVRNTFSIDTMIDKLAGILKTGHPMPVPMTPPAVPGTLGTSSTQPQPEPRSRFYRLFARFWG